MPDKEFQVKQVLLSLDSESYKIKSKGVSVYQVKGDGFGHGSTTSFQTMDGTELAALKQFNQQRPVPWKTFQWIKNGKVWATASQGQSYWNHFEKKLINVDIPGENDYRIIGDRFAWKFEVFKGDVKVADIDKKWGLVDTYGVRVKDGADEVNILLCAILVDHVYHNEHQPNQPPAFDRASQLPSKRRSV